MFGFQESSNVNLKEGVNEGLTINEFFKFEEGKYGPQVYCEFSAGELSLKGWFAPPNKMKADGTPNEYYDKNFKQFNETLTQFVTGFYAPEEKDVVAAKINAAAQGITGVEMLEQYCKNILETCLPADWKNREVSIVLHYKESDSAYLSIPKKAALNNGRIFSAHPSRTLEIGEWFKNNMMGKKETNAPTAAANVPAPSDVNWG